MRETEVTLAAIGASLTLFRHDGTPPPHRSPGRTGRVSPATPPPHSGVRRVPLEVLGLLGEIPDADDAG